MKSAIASRAASSWSSVSRCCSDGSASTSAGQSCSASGSPRTSPATRAELVDHGGVEVLAALGAGDLDGGVDAAGAVVDLDGVGQVEQAHRQRDLLAADIAGHALAVPAGEHLVQRHAHVLAEVEPLRHARGGEAVRHQAPLDGLAAGQGQVGAEADAAQGGTAGADVAEHEAEHRQPGEVDVVAVGPEGDVVAEQGGDLGGVGDAAHPRQRRRRSTGRRAPSGSTPRCSPSAAAMRQDRSTWSMGWPRPRSVARENAPTRSASVTPESCSAACMSAA